MIHDPALVLALISVWMVIGLFTYMNYSARRLHLSLWTVSWMFYSVYLAASIGLEESPRTPLLVMVTGFADMPTDDVEAKRRPDLILRKPITQIALRQAIARVLATVPKVDQPNQAVISRV